MHPRRAESLVVAHRMRPLAAIFPAKHFESIREMDNNIHGVKQHSGASRLYEFLRASHLFISFHVGLFCFAGQSVHFFPLHANCFPIEFHLEPRRPAQRFTSREIGFPPCTFEVLRATRDSLAWYWFYLEFRIMVLAWTPLHRIDFLPHHTAPYRVP